jgi:hypothetical protein
MKNPQRAEVTFIEFWRDYLCDHAQAGTRALHLFGTSLGVAALILGVVMLDPMIALLGVAIGYVFAWSGHLLIERNRPSMLARPAWSLVCDVRMWRLWLGGQLDTECARIQKG